MEKKESVHGIVLAGGRSSRMGSRKELLELGGGPILLHVVKRLQAVPGIAAVTVVTDAVQTYPFLPQDVSVVRDIEPDCGPVGGIATGMAHHDAAFQLVVGCDYPLAEAAFLAGLVHVLEQSPELDAVVPQAADERLHPLLAVYRRTTYPLWRELLEARELRVMRGLSRLRYQVYTPLPEEIGQLVNMNTPVAYAQIIGQPEGEKGWETR